jgi:hypothetical protein
MWSENLREMDRGSHADDSGGRKLVTYINLAFPSPFIMGKAKRSPSPSSSHSEDETTRLQPNPASLYAKEHAMLQADTRFNPPPPSLLARLGVVAVILFGLWLSIELAPRRYGLNSAYFFRAAPWLLQTTLIEIHRRAHYPWSSLGINYHLDRRAYSLVQSNYVNPRLFHTSLHK